MNKLPGITNANSQEGALGAPVALPLGVEGALMRHVSFVVRRRPRHAKQLKRPERKTQKTHTQQYQQYQQYPMERPSSTEKKTDKAREHQVKYSKDFAAPGMHHGGINIRYTRGLRNAMVVQRACRNRAWPKRCDRARQQCEPNITVDERPSSPSPKEAGTAQVALISTCLRGGVFATEATAATVVGTGRFKVPEKQKQDPRHYTSATLAIFVSSARSHKQQFMSGGVFPP